MIAITLVVTVKDICQHRTYRYVFIIGLQCSLVIKITATGKIFFQSNNYLHMLKKYTNL